MQQGRVAAAAAGCSSRVSWGRSQRGQATKGVWGMPWHQEARKGVEDCDKPGGSVKRELIPGSLNHRRVNP